MAQYTIKHLEVGYHEAMPAGMEEDPSYRKGEMWRSPFAMSLISGEGKHILVDCGLNTDSPEASDRPAPSHAPKVFHPKVVLEGVNLTPEDIDAVILTHIHSDHVNGATCYPNATFYVQKEEFLGWIEAMSNPTVRKNFTGPIRIEDLHTLLDLLYEGRLILLDGEMDNLFDGIHIRVCKFAHSFAHSSIFVEHMVEGNLEHYAIVGDLCNRPENLLGTPNRPGYMPNTRFAIGGVLNTIHSYDQLMDWVQDDVSHVIMTHDGSWQDGPKATCADSGLFIHHVCG